MVAAGLDSCLARMRGAGTAPHAVAQFVRAYERLVAGERGWLPESELEPVEHVAGGDGLGRADAGASDGLHGVAIVRLNGGLGTTMATDAGKGGLEVKPGLSFVELAIGRAEALRRDSGQALPLLFMNGTATGPAAAPDGAVGRPGPEPGAFVQSWLPRVGADDLAPVEWPRDPSLEWAPAGHGDVFPALARSGWLGALCDAGFEYACISSVDNVAAVVDGRIATAMRRESIPFVMEVADRTDVDRKGGHLACRRGGGFVLRDRAQVPPDEQDAFQDIARHRFFNTNTIWVELRALAELLARRDLLLDLPLIANHKVLDPYDETSPEVIQVESAMGSGISVFAGAEVRRVERDGFNPVKTTAELLAVRSDAYVLTPEHRIELAPERAGRAPTIELDPVHFARQRDFDERFAAGPLSLIGCDSLVVRGDVSFGAGVVVRGSVCIDHPGPGRRHVPSGSVLDGGQTAAHA